MRFYTEEEIQDVLQVSRRQAKALMRTSGFPSIRIGRTINVDSISSDVDVKKLAKEVSNTVMNDYSKYMRKDMMKLTGRNR